MGDGIPRAVLHLVPQGATTEAEAATAAAAAEPVLAGGAVVAAGGSVILVCLTAKAAADGVETPIDIVDSFYGTHFGDIHGWVQGCYAPRSTPTGGLPGHTPEMKTASESLALPSPVPIALADGDKGKKKIWGRVYATYTKFNPTTHRYYAGRTSMIADLSQPLRPQAVKAVEARDSNHHIDENDEPKASDFLSARLDRFDVGTAVDYAMRYRDVAYWRIRGREQQLIDSLGGAQADSREPYQTENVKRGVAKDNRLGRLFHDAATRKWGQIWPYTGN